MSLFDLPSKKLSVMLSTNAKVIQDSLKKCESYKIDEQTENIDDAIKEKSICLEEIKSLQSDVDRLKSDLALRGKINEQKLENLKFESELFETVGKKRKLVEMQRNKMTDILHEITCNEGERRLLKCKIAIKEYEKLQSLRTNNGIPSNDVQNDLPFDCEHHKIQQQIHREFRS